MPGSQTGSTARLLSLGWVVLIVYASLYPFEGWRWPPGASAADLARLPWPGRMQRLDAFVNLLGYMPLGTLLQRALASRRAGRAALLATVIASLLSYAMEATQAFLPPRVPSLLDWAINSTGAALGAILALIGERAGVFAAWSGLRSRWLEHADPGLVLLLCAWPVALFAPAAAPFGLGQFYPGLRESLLDLLDRVVWAEPATEALLAAAPPDRPMSVLSTVAVASLGLIAPVLVAYAAQAPGWRRPPLAAAMVLAAFSVTSLSTGLNFGPEHSFAWWTPPIAVALFFVALLALVLAPLSQTAVAALALLALGADLALVAQAPTDAYLAQRLQSWILGGTIHFNGVSRWVAMVWPFATIAWLLGRLAGRRGSA